MVGRIHSQKVDPRLMTCRSCKDGNCGACVDILRSVYTDEMICTCTRLKHLGEPTDEQILDPETNTVYAPGLSVSELGEVAVDPVKRKLFIKQFTDYLKGK